MQDDMNKNIKIAQLPRNKTKPQATVTAPQQSKPVSTTHAPQPNFINQNTAKPGQVNWNDSYRSIYDMQEQIIALHDDLNKDKDFAAFQGSKQKDTTATGPESNNSAFLNFMLKNFNQGDVTQHNIGDKDVSNYDEALNNRIKGKDTFDIRKIMDSIKNIGGHKPGGLTKPDGKWGPLTNDALKNIYIFAAAMSNIQKELDIKLEPLDLRGLANVPAKDTDIDNLEKAKRAPIIAENIKKLRLFFSEFKKNVFENPEYRNLIDQKSKFPTSIGVKSKSVVPTQNAIDPYKIVKSDGQFYEGKFEGHDVKFNPDIKKWEYIDENSIGNNSKLKVRQDIDTYKAFTEGKAGPQAVFYINRSLSSTDNAFDKNNNMGVSLTDISSSKNFKEFLSKHNVTIDNKPAILNKDTLLKAYNKIKEMIDKGQIQLAKVAV